MGEWFVLNMLNSSHTMSQICLMKPDVPYSHLKRVDDFKGLSFCVNETTSVFEVLSIYYSLQYITLCCQYLDNAISKFHLPGRTLSLGNAILSSVPFQYDCASYDVSYI